MGKHILVLTGSARKGGNSDLLADAFIKGAQSAGHTVDKFATAFHKIGGCLGCDQCWRKGQPCVQNDDVNAKMAPLLEKADALVFCMPLYAYSFPAQIKAAVDRMFPYGKGDCPRKLKIKETALIICGADDEGDAPFQAAIQAYALHSGYHKWTDRGAMIVPGVYDKGAVAKTEYLQRAETLGETF